MRTLTLTIPGIPPSWNEVMRQRNPHQQHATGEEWRHTVFLIAMSARHGRRWDGRPFENATVTLGYWFPDARRRDPDNYSGKHLLDGLRHAGVIVDDDFAHITLRIERRGVDKHNPRVEITVSEVSEGVEVG